MSSVTRLLPVGLFLLFQEVPPQPEYPGRDGVPQVTGLHIDQAVLILRRADLGVEVAGAEELTDYPPDYVSRQDPPAGAPRPHGVRLWISNEQGVRVPSVVGQRLDAAHDSLAARELVGQVVGTRVTGRERGTVVEQHPGAGELVRRHTIVELWGATPPLVEVPPVVGEEAAAAIAALGERRLVGAIAGRGPSEEEAGTVTRQDPEAGTEVEPGSGVDLWISTGPATVEVPPVIGRSLEDARRLLRGSRLVGKVVGNLPSEQPLGTVAEQAPAAGERARVGAVVELWQATPLPVEVPPVVGLNEAAARGALGKRGLVGAIADREASEEPAGTVIRQRAEAGERVEPGAVVDLWLSSGPTRVLVPLVVGLSHEDALVKLARSGLGGHVAGTRASGRPTGTVVEQAPLAGGLVAPGAAVELWEAERQGATVPGLEGLTETEALRSLIEVGLWGRVVARERAAEPIGVVFSQEPAEGTAVEAGSAVTLRVSSGPPPAVTGSEFPWVPAGAAALALLAAGAGVGWWKGRSKARREAPAEPAEASVRLVSDRTWRQELEAPQGLLLDLEIGIRLVTDPGEQFVETDEPQGE